MDRPVRLTGLFVHPDLPDSATKFVRRLPGEPRAIARMLLQNIIHTVAKRALPFASAGPRSWPPA
jgi:hypothetical protein